MNLEGIISVSGKPGLFKVVSKKKNGLIVESIPEKKKLNVFALDKVSALEDISIYTYEEDIPLKEVYSKLFELEEGKPSIDHMESGDNLRAKMIQILPDFDQDRVYSSDLKKLFQWYNTLISADLLVADEKTDDKEEDKKEDKKEENN